MNQPGSRVAIATRCANELTHKISDLKQRFRLSDGECVSMLAGMMITLCAKNGIEPMLAMRQAVDEANKA